MHTFSVTPANIAINNVDQNYILWPTFLLPKVLVYLQPLLHKLPNSVDKLVILCSMRLFFLVFANKTSFS